MRSILPSVGQKNRRLQSASIKQTSIKLADMASSPKIVEAASTVPMQTPEARLEAAYIKFMRTPKETPEYDKAWEELVDVIFINAT